MAAAARRLIPFTVSAAVGRKAYEQIARYPLSEDALSGILWTVTSYEKLHAALALLIDEAFHRNVPWSEKAMGHLKNYFELMFAVVTVYQKCCVPEIAMAPRKAEWEMFALNYATQTHYNRYQSRVAKTPIDENLRTWVSTLRDVNYLANSTEAEREEFCTRSVHSFALDLAEVDVMIRQMESPDAPEHNTQIRFLAATRNLQIIAFDSLITFFKICEQENSLREFWSTDDVSSAEHPRIWQMIPTGDQQRFTAVDLVDQMRSVALDVNLQIHLTQHPSVFKEWWEHYVDSIVFNGMSKEVTPELAAVTSNYNSFLSAQRPDSETAFVASVNESSKLIDVALKELDVSYSGRFEAMARIMAPDEMEHVMPHEPNVFISATELNQPHTSKDMYYRTLKYLMSDSMHYALEPQIAHAAGLDMRFMGSNFAQETKTAVDKFHIRKFIIFRDNAAVVANATLQCTKAAVGIVPVAWTDTVAKAFGSAIRPKWHVDYINDIIVPIISSQEFESMLAYTVADAKLANMVQNGDGFQPLHYKRDEKEAFRMFKTTIDIGKYKASRVVQLLTEHVEGSNSEKLSSDISVSSNITEPVKTKDIERSIVQARPVLNVKIDDSSVAAVAETFQPRHGPFGIFESVDYEKVTFIRPDEKSDFPAAFRIATNAELNTEITKANRQLLAYFKQMPGWPKEGEQALFADNLFSDNGIGSDYVEKFRQKQGGIDKARLDIQILYLKTFSGFGIKFNIRSKLRAGDESPADFDPRQPTVITQVSATAEGIFKLTQSHAVVALFLYRAVQILSIRELMDQIEREFSLQREKGLFRLFETDAQWKQAKKMFMIELEAIVDEYVKTKALDVLLVKMAHHYRMSAMHMNEDNNQILSPAGIRDGVRNWLGNSVPNINTDDPIIASTGAALIELFMIRFNSSFVMTTLQMSAGGLGKSAADYTQTLVSRAVEQFYGKKQDMGSDSSGLQGSTSADSQGPAPETESAQDNTRGKMFAIDEKTMKGKIKAVRDSNEGQLKFTKITELPFHGCTRRLTVAKANAGLKGIIEIECPVDQNGVIATGTSFREDFLIDDPNLIEAVKKAEGGDVIRVAELDAFKDNKNVQNMVINFADLRKSSKVNVYAETVPKIPLSEFATNNGTSSPQPKGTAMPPAGIVVDMTLPYLNATMHLLAWGTTQMTKVYRARCAAANPAIDQATFPELWRAKYLDSSGVILFKTFSPYGIVRVGQGNVAYFGSRVVDFLTGLGNSTLKHVIVNYYAANLTSYIAPVLDNALVRNLDFGLSNINGWFVAEVVNKTAVVAEARPPFYIAHFTAAVMLIGLASVLTSIALAPASSQTKSNPILYYGRKIASIFVAFLAIYDLAGRWFV